MGVNFTPIFTISKEDKMKRLLFMIMVCFVIFCTSCGKKKTEKSVQNIENGEEVIANVNEKTLTSEKWIDIGYRPSDTIEYYFFEGETYKSQLLNGAEFETGVYKIENDKVMLLDSGIEFEYIDDGVFKIINGKRMIRQDEV